MKKALSTTLLLLLAIIISACSSSDTNAPEQGENENVGQDGTETFTLTFNSAFPAQDDETDPQYLATVKFVELVEERTDGRVTFDMYYNNQLAGQAESVDALSKGTIDLQNTTPSIWASRIPEGAFTTLQYLAMGEDHMFHLLNETKFGELYEEALADYGIKPLLYWHSGATGYMSNSPIAKKDDYSGLVVNALDSLTGDLLSSMGAGTASVPYVELYEAMSRGVIDTMDWSYMTLKKYNLHEVVDYISAIPHIYPQMGMIAISMDTWDKLPEDIQTILLETGKEMEIGSTELSKAQVQGAVAFAKEMGIKIVEMTDEDFTELLNHTIETQWKAFGEINERTKEMLEIALEVREVWLKDNPEGNLRIQ